jgi:hypothetical protein
MEKNKIETMLLKKVDALMNLKINSLTAFSIHSLLKYYADNIPHSVIHSCT